MGERKEPVKPVLMTKTCDKCGGDMKPTGEVFDIMPPIYTHACEDCGEKQSYRETYPRIEYEAEDE